ncbi:MAG: hypothetical protein LBQ50_04595 [Planctomycetaceae bacterium]|jgi:hypothetical protein|nr:hypothetical protein [Planctomycetaceae bacterium]
MTPITQNALLAPLEIWEVTLDHSTIKFHQPLILTQNWMSHDPDEPGEIEYLEVEEPSLAISAFGENREELFEVIHGDIRIAWKYIVQADPKKLSPQNKTVQDNYFAIAEEITDE